MTRIAKVGVFNVVALNGGDAAILRGLLEHVALAHGREAATRAVIYEHRPEVARRYNPDLDLRPSALAAIQRYPSVRGVGWRVRTSNLWRWETAARLWRSAPRVARALLRPAERRKMAELAGLDLAISTGGTYLVERYSPWARLVELRVLELLGVPVVLYTQSLGPFETPEIRRRAARVLAGAALVLVRDARSHDHVRDVAPVAEAHVVSDVVFTMATSHARRGRRPARPAAVAISVREWDRAGRDAYVDAMRRLAMHLVEDGVAVTFVSTCQGVPEYWTDDSRLAAVIAAGLPDRVRDLVTVDRAFRDPHALREMLGSFDLVVATRMHAAILALCARTPVLPIAYEFKTVELFRQLGLGAHVVPVEQVAGDVLVEAVKRLWADGEALDDALGAGVDAQRRSADSAVARLSSIEIGRE